MVSAQRSNFHWLVWILCDQRTSRSVFLRTRSSNYHDDIHSGYTNIPKCFSVGDKLLSMSWNDQKNKENVERRFPCDEK